MPSSITKLPCSAHLLTPNSSRALVDRQAVSAVGEQGFEYLQFTSLNRFLVRLLLSSARVLGPIKISTPATLLNVSWREAIPVGVSVFLMLQALNMCFAQTTNSTSSAASPNVSAPISSSTTGAASTQTSQVTSAQASLPIKTENHPAWRDLDANQKVALAPLQKMWSKMSDYQKQKWLVISKNYMTLSSDEQSRIQGRMREWVSLSNEERAAARLNFAEVNQLSEDEKKQKWEAYQALEPGAKQKLLDQSPPLPKGVAIAIKPTDKALLTLSPIQSASMTSGPSVSGSGLMKVRIDTSQLPNKTLLRPLLRTPLGASAPSSTPSKPLNPSSLATPQTAQKPDNQSTK